MVTDTLRWGDGTGSECNRLSLQGQSRDGAILRLKDSTPEFSDGQAPRAAIWTGLKGTDHYRNSVRNLTVHTGNGNPGAVGLQFIANKVGCVRDVLIVSGDGQGVTGLDMASAGDAGPLFVKNLVVCGFEVGVRTGGSLHSQTFERVLLTGQRRVGFLNEGQSVSVRGLRTVGSVPAFHNRDRAGLAVIVDAQLNGQEAARSHAAILNRGGLFVRNLVVDGFAQAIGHSGTAPTNIAGPRVSEWTSEPLRHSGPSLNMPIEETPEPPWDSPDDWANAVAFGAGPDERGDDSGAIQRAIDSGKRTVYLPRGEYVMAQPIQLRWSF